MFVATQHNFSSGYGSWEIDSREWSSLAEAKEVLCHGMFECSEHCRGVKIKVIRNPPTEWLEKQIQDHLEMAKHHFVMMFRLENRLKRRRKRRGNKRE